MNERQFDHIIASRLRNHESQVDPDLWKNISGNIQSSGRRRYTGLLWGLLTIILIGITSIIVVQQTSKENDINEVGSNALESNQDEGSTKMFELFDDEVERIDHSTESSLISGDEIPVKETNPSQSRESESAMSENYQSPEFLVNVANDGSSFLREEPADLKASIPEVRLDENNSTLTAIVNSDESNVAQVEVEERNNLDVAVEEDIHNGIATTEIKKSEWKERMIRSHDFLESDLESVAMGGTRPRISYNACRVQTNTECYSFTPSIRSIYLDFLVGPAYHFSDLNAKNPESIGYQGVRESTESYLFSFTADVRATMVWKSGVTLSTGLSFTQLGEKFDYFDPNAQQTILNLIPVDTIFGPPPANNITIIWDTLSIEYIGERTVVQHNKYRFLDIPLTVGYEIESEKFILNINAGVMINLLFTQRGKILSPDEDVVYLQDGMENSYDAYRTNAGFSLIGSLGMAYKLEPDIHLLLEPHVRYNIKSLDNGANPVEHRMALTGLRFGIRKIL